MVARQASMLCADTGALAGSAPGGVVVWADAADDHNRAAKRLAEAMTPKAFVTAPRATIAIFMASPSLNTELPVATPWTNPNVTLLILWRFNYRQQWPLPAVERGK
jgi:hypothetical protein